MYVLDSDTLSVFQDRRGEESRRIQRRLAMVDPANVFVSIISFQEQANGWSTYIRRAKKPDAVVRGYKMFERLLSEFLRLNVLSFDDEAARIFEDFKARKVRVGTMDLRIASIALSHGFAVVTRNTVDFQRIPDLRCEDWTLPWSAE